MPKPKRLLAAGAIVALVVAAIGVGIVFLTRDDAYAFKGGIYSPAYPAPPLDLTDQDGSPFSLDELKGQVGVIYFGYTTCPDICPTTLIDFSSVKSELGADADRVKFLMVTVDPDRDSTARLKEYMSFFDPAFIGLRGTDEQTSQFERDYGVMVTRVEHPESATGYLLDHTASIYVVDPEGNLKLIFPNGSTPADMAEDIRHLL
jgi:protein SCO1/2